jgi:NADH-quinone oxidoreductase subunit C
LSSPEAPEATEATDEVAAEVPEPEPTATDERREALLAAFQRELGDAVAAHHIRPGDDLWLRIRTDAWVAAGEAARHRLGLHYFTFLSAIDWRPSPFGRYEDAEIDETPIAEKVSRPYELAPGYTGSDTRFQVFARVADVERHQALTLKVDVPDDTLALGTWTTVYAGADWHERETWEMFGITFVGHPDLRHLYLPSGFEGHPLRKDFPLLARVVKPWPGIVDVEPMPGETDTGPAENAEKLEGGTDDDGADAADGAGA